MTAAERDRKVDELRAIESRLRHLGEYYCAYQVRRSIRITLLNIEPALVRRRTPRAWERAIDEHRLAAAQQSGDEAGAA